MTTLATGLPISKSVGTKITPALRLSVQKATSVFQKDFCYDFLQALVDEPEISDPIGLRVFLNFCLRKPDALVDSFLDSIDQNVTLTEDLHKTSDTILNEVENFLEFIHGLIEMIDSGEVFKLAYHEIDAWKLCYKLLDPIQRRLFDLAVQDRQRLSNSQPQDDAHPSRVSVDQSNELTFASDSPSSGFYQSFVTIDKFLKHSFESRVLLEPAKLVEELDQLNERKTELQTFRTMFPAVQSSSTITKKSGRFGREEAAIENFFQNDKFKDLQKLKSTMSGGRLTRQPSTRNRKKATEKIGSDHHRSPSITVVSSRGTGEADRRTEQGDEDSAHIDPFLRDADSPPRKQAFSYRRVDSSSDDEDTAIYRRRKSQQPTKSNGTNSAHSTTRKSLPTQSSHLSNDDKSQASKRKRTSRQPIINDDKDATINKKPKAESAGLQQIRKRRSTTMNIKKEANQGDDGADGNDEVFEIEKIIGENVDINGEVIYKVLWAGYPESEATWQFANTLDDCAAVDIWEEQKKNDKADKTDEQTTKAHRERSESPAALAVPSENH